MANKRTLKKQIRQACGSLAANNILSLDFFPGIKLEDVEKIVTEVAALQVGSLKRASVAFDKQPKDFDNLKDYHKARRAYYHQAFKALVEGFNKEVAQIVMHMNAALPKEAREANVKALKGEE